MHSMSVFLLFVRNTLCVPESLFKQEEIGFSYVEPFEFLLSLKQLINWITFSCHSRAQCAGMRGGGVRY